MGQDAVEAICVLGINHWGFCMTKAEWSGWVQAIGSVAAVLGAAWAVHRQHALEVARARREALLMRADTLEAVFQICNGMSQKIVAATQLAIPSEDRRLWYRKYVVELEVLEESAARQELRLLSGYEEVECVAGCLTICRSARSIALDAFFSDRMVVPSPATYGSMLGDMVDSIRRRVERLEQMADKAAVAARS